MDAQNVAQGLAGLGRGKDTMLMHVTPNEVAGLQQLALAQGGSLTTNPETGLPEASFLEDVLGVALPIAAGFALGPAGLGLSAMKAGLLTGALAYGITGDPMKGITAGFGGAGGAGLGKNLAAYGGTPEIAQVASPGFGSVSSSVPGTTGASMFTDGAGSLASGAGTGTGAGQIGMANSFNLASDAPLNTVANVGHATSSVPSGVSGFTQNVVPNLSQGASNFLGMGEAGKNPFDYFTNGPGTIQDAMTIGAPFLAAASAPQELKSPSDTSYQMNYGGPYVTQDREMRMPTLEEQQQMNAQGSPEFSYFRNSNPVPGFQPAFAIGGAIQTGGIHDLYGTRDDDLPDPALSRDGYGLGRLHAMSEGGMAQYNTGAPDEVRKAIGGGLKNGGFVVPADVVSHLGNGSTDAGLALLQKRYAAKPIKGAGDGMSDSIRTTIDGTQPARIADGEAFVSPEQVKRNGGAKKFYAMMDKVRTSRTGTKKQGKQINPNKYLPA